MSDNKDKADKVKEGQVTYDMYLELPEDAGRFEVLNGVLELMSPAPSATHQLVSGELNFILKQSCKSEYMIISAPFDVILSPTNVVQPDILMLHRSRLHILTERGIEGAPDLVVEIVSPGSRRRDKVVKLKTYAKHGVPEYWIVDTKSQMLEQYRLADGEEYYELQQLFEGDDIATSDRLPCVSFVVSSIFADLRT